MQRRLKIKKTAVLGTAVFVVALGGYVLSDAILQQNTLQLAKSSEREGEYAHLVSWLPQDAKLAIEYRAKYLFYQTRMNRARKLDAKVEAIFTFADYIKVKDPKGSDEMMVSLVTNPEYKNSRRAYRAYAFLLLNDKSRHPVQIREFHDYMKTLKWEEDIYYAWEEGQKRLNAMRAKDAVYLDFYAPLLENPKPYTNYDRFYTDIERRAPKVEGKQELAERAARIKADNKAGKRWLSQDLLRAPLEYRERYQDVKQSIAEAGTPEELVSALTSLAVLTRGKDDAESNATFDRLLDTPELKNASNAYLPLSNLLLYKKSKRQLSVEQYHKVLEGIKDPRNLYLAWEAGYQQLLNEKAAPKVMMEYLAPLLDQEIKYRDYALLFREIVKQAEALKDADKATRANRFLQRVQDIYMPSVVMDDENFNRLN